MDKPSKPANKMIQVIVSCYFWIELFGISAILFPVSLAIFLLTAAFDRRLTILHRFTCLWSYIVLSINPYWRIRVTGREKIDPGETYVIVSNHQSGADIIVLYLLWTHFKWIAKRSLFLYPFIGWNMFLNRYIAIDRNSKGSMRKMMQDAAKALRNGNSIMIFPEGTRSKTGEIQPFRTGAFHLALENKMPLLPVSISGTSRAIRKNGFLINRNHDILATVLDPVPFSEIAGKSPKEIAGIIHRQIASSLRLTDTSRPE